MKQKFYLLLTVAAVAFTGACGGAATTTSETGKTNATSNAPASATTNAKTETAAKPASVGVKQSTPTEAGESFYAAVKGKDKTAFRSLMTKDSLEILEAAAQAKKMTTDELLDKEFFINAAMPAKHEQRNEKITGDKATIEMKDETGEWSPMTFLKEGGAWKVSLE